ncbi:FAD binding domain-containing protein [Thermodesulfobacteriota bacterium]
MKRFEYYMPQSLKEAYALMEKYQDRARYVAGGTDVMVRINQKALHPDALVSLRGLEELKGIADNGGITLGSMTLLRDIERDSFIARHCPALTQAMARLANPQIRNVATIGGNLCNAAPSADGAPPLMVAEAVLTIEGPGGTRDVPVEDFFTGPGGNGMGPLEILKAVRLPKLPDRTGMAFLKVGRTRQDLAIVNASALLVMENGTCKKCRLAIGAVAPVPLRLKKVEEMVEGRKIDSDLLLHVGTAVEREVRPINDVRSTEEYRRTVSGVLIRRAIGQALEMTS